MATRCRRSTRSTRRTGSDCRRSGTRARASRGRNTSGNIPTRAARALACYAYPYRIVFVAHATADGSAELDTRHNFAVIHNGLDRRRLVAAAAGHRSNAGTSRRSASRPTTSCSCCSGPSASARDSTISRRRSRSLPDGVASRTRTFFVGDREGDYQRGRCTRWWRSCHDERRARVTIVSRDRRGRTLLPRRRRVRLHVAGRKLSARDPRGDGLGICRSSRPRCSASASRCAKTSTASSTNRATSPR